MENSKRTMVWMQHPKADAGSMAIGLCCDPEEPCIPYNPCPCQWYIPDPSTPCPPHY